MKKAHAAAGLLALTMTLLMALAGCAAGTSAPPAATPAASVASAPATTAPMATVTEDKLQLQTENEHFQFYSYDKDKSCLDDLARNLEDNYERITKDLKVTMKDQMPIYVYPDIKTYHTAIGMPSVPDWQVGTGWGNMIKMVSPLNPGSQHTYDSLMQVVVHEFTHIVTSNINPNINLVPIWLNEGLATYEAKQNDTAALKGKLSKDTIPSLSELNSANFSDQGGYVFSYVAIEYIVKNRGYDTIISLIKAPNDLENILRVSEAKFEDQWKTYCVKEYN